MSDIETSITQQSNVLETKAEELAAGQGPPAEAGKESTPRPEEPAAIGAPQQDEPDEGGKKHPISAEKLAANRANAQRSTGPRTPEGKENSKYNAVTHGLTARYFPAVIQRGSVEWQEFEALRVSLIEHYRPMTAAEELLLEKITIEYVRYRRLVEREQEVCVAWLSVYLDVTNRMARYQTAINRQLFEAMEKLEELQSKRKEEQRSSAAKESVRSSQNEPTSEANDERKPPRRSRLWG
jgi:hypothetical protein